MKEPLVLDARIQRCAAAPKGTERQRSGLARLEEYLKRRHGEATLVTVYQAPAIRRVGEERWW